MVTFNKQLSKNIFLVCGELNNWGYKEIEDNEEYDSIPFPKCFELTFKFMIVSSLLTSVKRTLKKTALNRYL